MEDRAHAWTDRRLARMERHISEIYQQAFDEIGVKWRDYLEEVGAQVRILQDEYDRAKASGDRDEIKRTGKALGQAVRERTIMNDYFRDLSDELARQISNVNKTSAAYINGELPEIYAENYNSIKKISESLVDGYTFNIVNPDTVRRLATINKTLLPYKRIDGRKDVRWNTKKINAQVLQGILQGESMDKIAGRLGNVLSMNEVSAIRNARTTVTAAENYGRFDSYLRMEDEGRTVEKVWTATLDMRTRHQHGMLDGKTAPLHEPFTVDGYKIMFPGDINAAPEMVYNCRCRMSRKIGTEKPTTRTARVEVNGKQKTVSVPYMTYEEWLLRRMQNGRSIQR